MRYAKSIRIDVALQTDTNLGIIYPPAIKIDYSTVSYTDAQNGQEVDVSIYAKSQLMRTYHIVEQ